MWKMDPMLGFDIRLCLHYRPETVHCSTNNFPCIITLSKPRFNRQDKSNTEI